MIEVPLSPLQLKKVIIENINSNDKNTLFDFIANLVISNINIYEPGRD